MSWWNAKYKNDHDEYEITFGSKYKEKTKIVEKVCKWIIDKLVQSEDDIAIVRHGPCPYCDAKNNDFIPLNQTVEYSGIEMALNRQGMLRVRVYEPGKETFTTQDIVEIKRCPFCGAKMDGDTHGNVEM